MSEQKFTTIEGHIIGYVQTLDNGDQVALSHPYRKILGYYRKSMDATTTLEGRIINRGNTVSALVYEDYYKNK